MDLPREPDPDTLLVSALPIVDQVVGFVGRRHRCRADELEEFSSVVRLKLVEKDFAVLRQFGGRSSLRTYLAVVIQRLFLDFRRHQWGVWRPSAEARRLGKHAIALDILLHRDGLPLDEAIEVLRSNRGVLDSADELRELAQRLPAHLPRRTEGDEALASLAVSAEMAVEGSALADERHSRAKALREGLSDALRALAAEDCLILRLRYTEGFAVARVAELLGLPARPLYRRIEGLLKEIKDALQVRGFASNELGELLGNPAFDDENAGATEITPLGSSDRLRQGE
jgi:RNA polymerase sigma factor (sigma-70 family)